MDMKHLIILALQVSILATVFGFGLRATPRDVSFLFRHRILLVKSLVAMFLIMPLVAISLVSLFDLTPTLSIALVALSVAPLPPLIPKRLSQAGGYAPYGIALMATVAVLSVVIVPLAGRLAGLLLHRPVGIGPGAVAALVLKTILVPLAAGMIVRATLPKIADRIVRPISLSATILLAVAVIVVVAGVLPTVWSLIGDGTILVMAAFVLIGLAVGHLLGGPDPDDRVVLAISSSCRHPAMALALASAGFSTANSGATILLYLLINVLAGIPYTIWQRRKLLPPTPAADTPSRP